MVQTPTKMSEVLIESITADRLCENICALVYSIASVITLARLIDSLKRVVTNCQPTTIHANVINITTITITLLTTIIITATKSIVVINIEQRSSRREEIRSTRRKK